MFSIHDVTSEMENDVNSMGLIPEGEHNFIIEHARYADNKMMNGHYVEITCILEGTGRKIWKYFNIDHANKKVENMAKVELKKLLNALKMEGFKQASELSEKMFRGKVEHTKDKTGKLQAEIKAFGPYEWAPGEKAEDVPF